jgi:hypothetical protein
MINMDIAIFFMIPSSYNAALTGKFGAQRKICPSAAPC